MKASPLRSMVLAGLSFVAAAVATLGAVYQASPTVTLHAPDGVVTELAPAGPDASPAPGQ